MTFEVFVAIEVFFCKIFEYLIVTEFASGYIVFDGFRSNVWLQKNCMTI